MYLQIVCILTSDQFYKDKRDNRSDNTAILHTTQYRDALTIVNQHFTEVHTEYYFHYYYRICLRYKNYQISYTKYWKHSKRRLQYNFFLVYMVTKWRHFPQPHNLSLSLSLHNDLIQLMCFFSERLDRRDNTCTQFLRVCFREQKEREQIFSKTRNSFQ